MKKNSKIRLLSAFLALFLMFGSLAFRTEPVKADVSTPTTINYQWYGGKGIIIPIELYGLSRTNMLMPTTVKSSNKKIAEVDYSSLTQYADPESYSDSAVIGLRVRKAGMVTVSYTIGSTPYTTIVNIQKVTSSASFLNPVSSLTVGGVNKGKNLVSKLKKGYTSKLPLKSTKASTLQVATNTGWTLTGVYLYDRNKKETRYRSYSFKSGESVVIDLAELKKASGTTHQLYLYFENTTGATTLTSTVTVNFK